MLSIIIPCYNEITTLEKVLDNIAKNYTDNKEIIVIDDFSNDGTRDLLKKISHKFNKLHLNDKNYGKGYSVRMGIKISSGDIIIIQDADLEYDPNDYKKLIDPIKKDIADVVYGSRFLGSEIVRVLYFWHRVGNLILTLFSNACTNLNLTDMECGYKAFRADVLKKIKLEENRFGFEPEVTAKIAKIPDIKIYETSVKYFGRNYNEGKKITWKDGFSAFRCILKYSLFK